jgi:hypothetical protein
MLKTILNPEDKESKVSSHKEFKVYPGREKKENY